MPNFTDKKSCEVLVHGVNEEEELLTSLPFLKPLDIFLKDYNLSNVTYGRSKFNYFCIVCALFNSFFYSYHTLYDVPPLGQCKSQAFVVKLNAEHSS